MNPNDELFCAADFEGTPLLAAIETLAEKSERSMDDLQSLRMAAVVQLARDQYGEENLPEIWKIWIDWNEGDSVQPMGDL